MLGFSVAVNQIALRMIKQLRRFSGPPAVYSRSVLGEAELNRSKTGKLLPRSNFDSRKPAAVPVSVMDFNDIWANEFSLINS